MSCPRGSKERALEFGPSHSESSLFSTLPPKSAFPLVLFSAFQNLLYNSLLPFSQSKAPTPVLLGEVLGQLINLVSPQEVRMTIDSVLSGGICIATCSSLLCQCQGDMCEGWSLYLLLEETVEKRVLCGVSLFTSRLSILSRFSRLSRTNA